MRIPGRASGLWRSPSALAALLVLADILLRVVLGSYRGSAFVLVLACGAALVVLLPVELRRASIQIAVVPALGIVAFTVLSTTIATVGIDLGTGSLTLAVSALVGASALAGRGDVGWARVDRDEWLTLGGIAGVVLFAVASAWDLVGPFPPDATDWGHYLLYADEVARERSLLLEDRFAGDEGRLFADSPGVGALYGGALILGGFDSTWGLTSGIVIIAALAPLTMYATGATLWGARAGFVAAGVYAASPIRMDPIRWHGIGTVLALVFVPLVVLALALMFRGGRDWRLAGLLGASLVGVAVTHPTSAYVVTFVVLAALVVDGIRQVVVHRSLQGWWREGILRPLALGVGLACVAGGAVVAHLRAQAADLGRPLSFEFFEPDWLTWAVVVDYYSLAFLALAAISAVLIVSSRQARHDSALLGVLALGVACVVVGELWRLEIPFEYRRAVQYLGIALALLVGAASVRFERRHWVVPAYLFALAYLAHVSVGLRLPERVLTNREPRGIAAKALVEVRERIDRGELPDASLLVADQCVNFIVPYLLQRPTIVAYEPWQVGWEDRLPLAARADAVLRGGDEGRRLVRELGVGYVVANPACRPNLGQNLGGRTIVAIPQLVVLDVRER